MRIQAQYTIAAVSDGESALSLHIEESAGRLTARVHRGGAELSAEEIAALGELRWYREGESCSTAEGQSPEAATPDVGWEVRLERYDEAISGETLSFTADAERPLKSLKVNIEPVQEGEGDPSPDNVRPITGWTGAKVTQTGKNLANPDEFVLGGLAGSGYVSSEKHMVTGFIPVEPGQTYTRWCSLGEIVSGTTDVDQYDSEKNYLGRQFSATFTVPDNCYYIRCEFMKADGGDVTSSDLSTVQVQVEKGSTFTGFESYTGVTYDISFGDAGTVYGGTLDVTTGMLTVDRRLSVFNGSESWGYENELSGVKSFFLNLNVNKYMSDRKSGTLTSVLKMNRCVATMVRENATAYISPAGYINVRSTSLSTAQELKESLAETNLQIVYPLATPVTYQLTPQEVTTLLGSNNIWADAGAVTAVTGSTVYARDSYRPAQRLHIRYSNDGMTFTANGGRTVGAWIGTLVDCSEEASEVFSDYTWHRFADDAELSGRLGVVETSVGELAYEMRTEYLAQSDFGSYAQQVTAQIEANARAITESYSYAELVSAAAAAGVSESLEQYMTTVNGQIRRGYLTDPATGETVIGIAISQKLQFTGSTKTVDGETCYELDAAQTFGLYTSTGWQFWVGGQKIGWFDSADGMLHVVRMAAEQELKLGDGWLITGSGGFGIRYTGG